MRENVARRLAVLAAVVAVAAVATFAVWSLWPAASFCNASGAGATPSSAINAYLDACGSAYGIERGPYDADASTSPYASYARVVEYTLSVGNNQEGSIGFLMVGQQHSGGRWRTLGAPGSGP